MLDVIKNEQIAIKNEFYYETGSIKFDMVEIDEINGKIVCTINYTLKNEQEESWGSRQIILTRLLTNNELLKLNKVRQGNKTVRYNIKKGKKVIINVN